MTINLIGTLGSLAVNLAGAVVGHLLLTVQVPECVCHRAGEFMSLAPLPEIAIGNSYFGEAGDGPQPPFDREDRVKLCSSDPLVRFEATPDFPIFGADRIFPAVTGNGADPVICALIDRNGQVVNAYMLRGTGSVMVDRQVLVKLRSLPFRPAGGTNGSLDAWHRLTILRSGLARNAGA